MLELIQNLPGYIIPFLIVLTILVFIHELGHYLVARWNGVKIETFSIGFGPEVFGFYDKAGTRWKFSLIPLGGYVKMYGDADASSKADTDSLNQMSKEERNLTLHSKPVGQRMAVVAAGPFANYLLAVIIMAFLFAIKGMPVIDSTASGIVDGSIAEKIGMKAGDRITKINDQQIATFNDLRKQLPEVAGKEVTIEIKRDQETLALKAKMVKTDAANGEEKPIAQLGIRPGQITYQPQPVLSAIGQAFATTYTMTVDTLAGLGQMITGKRSSDEMGGILAIGDMASQSAKSGLASLFWFMAILSINLGLINLLPIPVLDGGHLVFYTIEAIRGKPVSQRAQEIAFTIGFFIVIGVMLLSTWNDLTRYKVFSWIKF